jgi:hypothetical protein
MNDVDNVSLARTKKRKQRERLQRSINERKECACMHELDKLRKMQVKVRKERKKRKKQASKKSEI